MNPVERERTSTRFAERGGHNLDSLGSLDTLGLGGFAGLAAVAGSAESGRLAGSARLAALAVSERPGHENRSTGSQNSTANLPCFDQCQLGFLQVSADTPLSFPAYPLLTRPQPPVRNLLSMKAERLSGYMAGWLPLHADERLGHCPNSRYVEAVMLVWA